MIFIGSYNSIQYSLSPWAIWLYRIVSICLSWRHFWWISYLQESIKEYHKNNKTNSSCNYKLHIVKNYTYISIIELFGPVFTVNCCSGETLKDLGLLESGEISAMDGCRDISGLWLPLFCITVLRWLISFKCPSPRSSREPFLFMRLSKLFVSERFAFMNIVLPTPTPRYWLRNSLLKYIID